MGSDAFFLYTNVHVDKTTIYRKYINKSIFEIKEKCDYKRKLLWHHNNFLYKAQTQKGRKGITGEFEDPKIKRS